ncbi:MAG: response regulator [Desulfomonilia bacterium]|jgi:DNA-binding response OmpR family regulator|nr:response regulator [Deltaproteobacteria bacterium]HPW68341.1 response regulator [Deltaproteobacteria bacterium]
MKKILLVEDDSHLQFLITEELKDEGYDVMSASNGKEALSLLFDEQRGEPDLIIMDIRMPKMDGLDALGHILKSKLDVPVVIHSAYVSYQDNPVAMTADAYVLKSHDFSHLKETVGKLLNRHAQSSSGREAEVLQPPRVAVM